MHQSYPKNFIQSPCRHYHQKYTIKIQKVIEIVYKHVELYLKTIKICMFTD